MTLNSNNIQEYSEKQKITKISYDEQGFCKIKEKFEFMINEKEIIVEKINETIEFYIIILGKRYLIGNILYKLEENSLKMFEFVTANFYNYSYSKKVFEKLHYSEEDFISEELYNKVKYKLNYLGFYMMYMLIEFTKKQGFDTFKIEEPVDQACKFYYKIGKLFEELGIIKKYNLPKYETIKLGNNYDYQKIIKIEL